jgi:flagellar basal body-associated protein FliL
VSRWLSPQKAARLAEQAQRRHTEKRKTALMLVGLAMLMLVTYVAWAVISARFRRTRHQHRDKKPSSQSGTNRIEASVLDRTRAFAKVEFETHVPRR